MSLEESSCQPCCLSSKRHKCVVSDSVSKVETQCTGKAKKRDFWQWSWLILSLSLIQDPELRTVMGRHRAVIQGAKEEVKVETCLENRSLPKMLPSTNNVSNNASKILYTSRPYRTSWQPVPYKIKYTKIHTPLTVTLSTPIPLIRLIEVLHSPSIKIIVPSAPHPTNIISSKVIRTMAVQEIPVSLFRG